MVFEIVVSKSTVAIKLGSIWVEFNCAIKVCKSTRVVFNIGVSKPTLVVGVSETRLQFNGAIKVRKSALVVFIFVIRVRKPAW